MWGSAKELEHYQRVREQFEKAEDEESKKKGKGKGKGKGDGKTVDGPLVAQVADQKGEGKTLMISNEDEREVDDAGLGSGAARLKLDLGSADEPKTQWEDSAEKDGEDLYGDGAS